MPRRLRSQDLFVQAKQLHRHELQLHEAQLSSAKDQLDDVRRWIEEIRRAAKSIQSQEDRSRVEQDLHDLATFETEIKSELRQLARGLRQIRADRKDVYTKALDLQAEEAIRAKRKLPITASVSSTKGVHDGGSNSSQPEPRAPTFVFRCFGCDVPQRVAHALPALYCSSCAPIRAARQLFAQTTIRRASKEFSIRCTWPTQVTGLPYQGGSPGLGRRA